MVSGTKDGRGVSDLPERYTCPMCGSDCSDDQLLTAHLKTQHECPICAMLVRGPLDLPAHLRRAHHVQIFSRLDWQGTDGFLGYVAESVGDPFCPLDIDVELLRISRRRLPGDPWPSEPKDLALWLYPMCLRLARQSRTPESAFKDLPAELENQRNYVEVFWGSLRAALNQKRLQALRKTKSRAAYFAKALALPELSPGTAEQKFRNLKFGH